MRETTKRISTELRMQNVTGKLELMVSVASDISMNLNNPLLFSSTAQETQIKVKEKMALEEVGDRAEVSIVQKILENDSVSSSKSERLLLVS
mmetsp:Transcript_12867/g.19941  ORF Transcript_12867/g.19941 Transcript_12867/m.19941 type:complete len:92 (+) Transcript_12867:894-1169(+)